MPSYFDFFTQDETAVAAGDHAKEARQWTRYLSRHPVEHKQARSALTGAARLQLYSFDEAPLLNELKHWSKMLEAFQWHKLSARRQQEALQGLIYTTGKSTLPPTDWLITMDWAEKLRLPMAPVETGAMWHAQQKLYFIILRPPDLTQQFWMYPIVCTLQSA